MTELVLGGAGLIGTELVNELRQRGHDVVSLDLKTGHDLRQPIDLKLFEQCDRVWFLAWDTGGQGFWKLKIGNTNSTGTIVSQKRWHDPGNYTK